MIRGILKYPDLRLKTVAESVTVFDESLQTLIDDMIETMKFYGGIGLAATQINVHLRVIIVDVKSMNGLLVLVNPVIEHASAEKWDYKEGCLSLPKAFETVTRPKIISVKYQNAKGEEQKIIVDDLASTCIQHEIDHLNGLMFIDNVSSLKRTRTLEKYRKENKRG